MMNKMHYLSSVHFLLNSGCWGQGLNVNRHAKEFLKEKFELWYADQVLKQVEAGKDTYDIDMPLKLSDLKTHSCKVDSRSL